MKAKFTQIMHYATRLVFFARTKSSSYIPLSAKKKYTIVMKKRSGKNFISVGMGAAKSNETR